MPLIAPRTPQPKNRRELIQHATLHVIGKSGVDSVTHRHVAAEAEIPLGSITYYFSSRDELIFEAFQYYLNDVQNAVAAIRTQLADMTRDTLVDALLALVQRDLEQPVLLRAEFEMLVYATRNAEIAEIVVAWQASLDAQLAEPLEKIGVARPFEGARAIRGLLRGYELEHLVQPGTSTDELRRRLEVTLNGLELKSAALP